ncbi:MAG: response regulator [Arenicella sp.]
MIDRKISVVVVDDHPLFRRGVVELLNETEELTVIAEFENGADLLVALDDIYPDILLLDLQMPDQSGLELLQEIRNSDHELKIVILTACEDQEKLLDALGHGANGYLQKDTAPEDMLNQLLSVMDGNIALSEDGVTVVAQHLRRKHEEETRQTQDILTDMTDREKETLYLITKGLNNKLIARELDISDGTVKVYVKNLLRKLNLHSRLELAAWAYDNDANRLIEDPATESES